MPRRLLTISILLSVLFTTGIEGADKGTAKDGWSVTPLPAVGYDSDFGFMGGGFIDINYYGGLYPNYRHRFCLEALVYSKHASYYMFQYPSRLNN